MSEFAVRIVYDGKTGFFKNLESNLIYEFKDGAYGIVFPYGHAALAIHVETKKLYEIFMVPTGTKFRARAPNGGLSCQVLCGHFLKRVHLSCLNCRYRKIATGKMRSRQRVSVYLITIRLDRNFAKLRDLLIKPLASLIEFLAS